MRPHESEYAPYYQSYVSRVTQDDIVPVLDAQIEELQMVLERCGPDRETHRYESGKWSVREVIGHLIDGERVFGYRAFAIARGESRNLPGFDQNDYIATAPYEHVNLTTLLEEFRLLRMANVVMFRNLDEQAWSRTGTANDSSVTVRALAFIMAGHVSHHLGILRERYLEPLPLTPTKS